MKEEPNGRPANRHARSIGPLLLGRPLAAGVPSGVLLEAGRSERRKAGPEGRESATRDVEVCERQAGGALDRLEHDA